MSRRTWYYDGHPPTCTCVGCSEQRSRGPLKLWMTGFLFGLLIVTPSRYVMHVLRRLGIIQSLL